MKINLKYFFRKPSEHFHSIEELFSNFQEHFPEDLTHDNIYLPHHSGIFGRIKNVFFSQKNKTQLNHITGDINYISLGLPKKRTILTIHDIYEAKKGFFIKKIFRQLFLFRIPLKRAAKISVVSDFSKNELLKTFKINERKIEVIPNCVSDKIQYFKKDFNSKNPNILLVGTKANKNIVKSLEAISEINCNVSIIGSLSASQEKKLDELNIDYQNYFNLSFDEVVRLYKDADLLLFPSTYEGFGMPIIEAQATGLPVITSDLQPMNDVAGKGALLVNPFNTHDIADAVNKIISNKNLRDKLITNGLENVKQYRSKAVAEKYYNLYKEVLKNAEK